MSEIRDLIDRKRKTRVRRKVKQTKGVVVDCSQLPEQMFNVEYPDTRYDN